VSPLMRRFLIVSAYCEEPVAYCLVADLESAERRGCRRACIVTEVLSRKHSWYGGSFCCLSTWVWQGSCDTTGILRRSLLANLKLQRAQPDTPEQHHHNTCS
jgi:hypothetical protein